MKLWFLLVLIVQITFAGEALETDSFDVVEQRVLQEVKEHGKKNVLVVFDIDNTILTMPQDLGSDQWFNWQYESCIKDTKQKPECVTYDMNSLIEIQGQLFAISNMVTPEPTTAKVVKRLQDLGLNVILLTSRGLEFRYSTERVLKMNNMWFASSAIGPMEGFAAPYLPYQLNKLAYYGLNQKDKETARLGNPRPVTYHNGIYMTAGQNKGIMLKTLLHKTGTKFKSIVFVDDHLKHTTRMQEILGKGKLDLVTFRYSKMDPQVNKFNQSDKKHVVKGWNVLREATTTVLK